MKALWGKFSSKSFRHTFANSIVSERLAIQIFTLRTSRGWTQKDASEALKMAQPRISKLETDCHDVTLTTLRRIAEAYDVALEVKFVPFSKMLRSSLQEIADTAVPKFEDDKDPSEAKRVVEMISTSPVSFSTLPIRPNSWHRSIKSKTAPTVYESSSATRREEMKYVQ